MAGLIGGLLAGGAQGAVDVAKTQIAANVAQDLAQVNANLAVEKEARIRENTTRAHAATASTVEEAVKGSETTDPVAQDRLRARESMKVGDLDMAKQYGAEAQGQEVTQARKETAKIAREDRRRGASGSTEKLIDRISTEYGVPWSQAFELFKNSTNNPTELLRKNYAALLQADNLSGTERTVSERMTDAEGMTQEMLKSQLRPLTSRYGDKNNPPPTGEKSGKAVLPPGLPAGTKDNGDGTFKLPNGKIVRPKASAEGQ